ncbi:MAG: hypothetical protein HRT45_16965 [Bdellovibrionales bacterium]|nr:hypothetical protein [Bdellovibrionales bacterium]
MFQVSSSLSQVRADFLAQKQSDYKQSLTYGLVVLLSIIGCLILFSISFYKQYSRAQHYKAQAITSSKLAALGEMAGGIAHEINNPLAVISGNIDTALMSLESERPNLEKILSRLGKARKTVDRVSNIVKSLKTISRDSSKDKKVEFELKDLVMEAVSLCSEKIRVSGIGLEVKVADGIRVEGNRTELSQVLINLINNSIDAVAEDSYPWLKIGSRPSDNGSLAELHIMDSGNGIPAEIAQDILKPFFTTKPIGQGTGLGLSISHGIVRRHGGNLWLDTKSKNTKFCMSLPAQFNAANKSVLRSA